MIQKIKNGFKNDLKKEEKIEKRIFEKTKGERQETNFGLIERKAKRRQSWRPCYYGVVNR